VKFEEFNNEYEKFLRKKEKINAFMIKKEIRSKKAGFQILKIHISQNYLYQKLKCSRIKYALEKIKFACIQRITIRLKKIGNSSRIKLIKNKYLKLKIKKLIFAIRSLIFNKEDVQKKFRDYYLMKNIFYFLKKFKDKEKRKNDIIIKNFTINFSKRKVFNLFINHHFLLRRQDIILSNLKRYYLKNRKRKLRSIFYYWKRFYICEKYRKYKIFQKKIKIFYSLKFLLNK